MNCLRQAWILPASTLFFDVQGNRIGTSGPGMLDSTIFYDNSGRKIGVSEISPLGGSVYYEIV